MFIAVRGLANNFPLPGWGGARRGAEIFLYQMIGSKVRIDLMSYDFGFHFLYQVMDIFPGIEIRFQSIFNGFKHHLAVLLHPVCNEIP